MSEPTWEQREQPVLEAIARLEESGVHATNEEIAEATGLAVNVVGRTMKRLNDAHFIEASDATSQGDHHPVYIGAEMLERGLRVVGAWPPDVAEAFIQRIEAAISNETDPAELNRLQRLKSAVAEVGKGVVAGAIVAAAQSGMT